jgi:hypothetical protein
MSSAPSKNGADSWRETRRDINRGARFGLGWWLILVLVALAVSAGIWALTVASSGPKGQGDALVQKNSAANWTAAQARFEQDYQDILATDQKIGAAHTALQVDPTDPTLQTNYTGLTSYCLSKVAGYNADARSYLSEDFRADDLPAQIDTTLSTTDCKE